MSKMSQVAMMMDDLGWYLPGQWIRDDLGFGYQFTQFTVTIQRGDPGLGYACRRPDKNKIYWQDSAEEVRDWANSLGLPVVGRVA